MKKSCLICGDDAVERHHVQYRPVQVLIHVCHSCHLKIHQRKGFYDHLAPEKERKSFSFAVRREMEWELENRHAIVLGEIPRGRDEIDRLGLEIPDRPRPVDLDPAPPEDERETVLSIDPSNWAEKARLRCPEGHTAWSPSSRWFWCPTCHTDGEQAYHQYLIDAKTGERVARWEVELVDGGAS